MKTLGIDRLDRPCDSQSMADGIRNEINSLARIIHGANEHWWTDNNGIDIRLNPLTFSNKLCLIHSEVSEALEGDRTGAMDKHCPEFENRTVELADAFLRILDLAAGYGLPIGAAVVAKMKYNADRADHKIENRKAAGGKSY